MQTKHAAHTQPIEHVSDEQVIFPSDGEALYYIPSNSFRFTQPAVPLHTFEAERQQLFEEPGKTRVIVMDLSAAMEIPYPASTPHLLARYLVIASGDRLTTSYRAASEIYYVMQGAGRSARNGQVHTWKAGDVLVLGGGEPTVHQAGAEGAKLYLVTDEPMLSFSGTVPLTGEKAAVKPALFTKASVDRYLGVAHARPASDDDTSKTVVYTTRQTSQVRSTTPWLTTNLNTLVPGGDQRPHRHNAAALTMAIESTDVFSVVDRSRVDWQPFGVMVTPPGAVHSHHNRGTRMMRSFVAQDSGLYYYARATGFDFVDAPNATLPPAGSGT